MAPDSKSCSVCRETKPLSEYYPNGPVYKSDCKVCHRAKVAAYKVANYEKVLAAKRADYHANPRKYHDRMAPHRVRNTRIWRERYPDKYQLLMVNRFAARRGATERITLDEYYAVRDRCGDRCQICGTTERLTWDHIVAIKDGGRHRPENLQLLCLSCNARKGNREKHARRR